MPKDLFTIDEAIRALGISRSTIWRRLQRGELPSVRRGARRLVRLTRVGKAVRAKAADDISPFTESHPIFRLVGAGRSGGQSPGARDKHAILDESLANEEGCSQVG
ncbi:MAG: helix-turn-helix domain-containing protein [Acidobacteriaceae bacterium]|nr:helix-turn-helix domain-containing protein [Acidobacteriaceae bacterium]MBV9295154.1 helix-turn-helix domain-containing protein [Acidobacteriaceae bacterium]MBV9766639.1 helix-turn-helix domain-containing protein [Acidobacteriaceae bacterium]